MNDLEMILQTVMTLALPVFLLVLGWMVGTIRERRHFRNLDLREKACRDIKISNLGRIPSAWDVEEARLVSACVVIASDYFKTFAAKLRNLVGGELRTYERISERAKREAIMRIVEEAKELGANVVCNVRIETSTITRGGNMGQRAGMASSEVIAYATALRVRPSR